MEGWKNCREISREKRNRNRNRKRKRRALLIVDMGDKKEVDLNAKWDACLDLTMRRFVYSSLAGAFGGLLFCRSPVTRWASIAFGAGLGIGSAYTDCNSLFQGSTAKLASPKFTHSPEGQD